ncbi:glycosyltransferase, partial [bacterium]|nr:glycosyltransferase [bacterium]
MTKIQDKEVRILMASGGTGGHAYPCLVVAQAIRDLEPEAKFIFVGAKGKMDEALFAKHGFDFASIDVLGIPRGKGAFNLSKAAKSALKIISMSPLIESLRILRKFRPCIVFGAGGYVSGPLIAAAWLKRIPRAILETNAVPGLANKLLSRFSNAIFTGMQPAAGQFPRRCNIIMTGNPVRGGSQSEGQSI